MRGIFPSPAAVKQPRGARKNTTQLAKYPHVLYAKPSNKVYLINVWTKFALNILNRQLSKALKFNRQSSKLDNRQSHHSIETQPRPKPGKSALGTRLIETLLCRPHSFFFISASEFPPLCTSKRGLDPPLKVCGSGSLRSKRFRLVSEQRKTEERNSRFWPREK